MRFFDWLCDDDDDNNSAKPYNTFGNGSTMRVSACGNIPLLTNWTFETMSELNKVLEVAKKSFEWTVHIITLRV